MRRPQIAGLIVVGLLASTTAWAQSGAITGTVTDASGAVLPGVTVEAASPALIEQSRTVVTDGAGNYKIIELRPGTYTAIGSRDGYRDVRRTFTVVPGRTIEPVNVICVEPI